MYNSLIVTTSADISRWSPDMFILATPFYLDIWSQEVYTGDEYQMMFLFEDADIKTQFFIQFVMMVG